MKVEGVGATREVQLLRPGLGGAFRLLHVTIAGLAEGAPLPGRSLAGLWSGSAAPRAVLSEVRKTEGQADSLPSTRGDMVSVVTNRYRDIRDGEAKEELYDVANDPWERTDLDGQAEHQSTIEIARRAVQEWQRQ